MNVTNPRRRWSTAALAALVGVLLLAVLTTPAAAQGSTLEVCVELTNDADGNRAFSDDETTTGGDSVAHEVRIGNCGDWDAVLESVVVTSESDTEVCDDLAGDALPVDAVLTCEFDLDAPTGDEPTTTEVMVTIADEDGERGTAEDTDTTTVTAGSADTPSEEPTEETTDEPTEDETDDASEEPTDDASEEPTDEPTEEAEEADAELAATGVGSTGLLAWGVVLLLAGILLVDAGRRPVLVTAGRGRADADHVRNPLLRVAAATARQLRWAVRDLRG